MKKTAGKERNYESPCLEVFEIHIQNLMDNSPLEDVEEGEEHGWDCDDD